MYFAHHQKMKFKGNYMRFNFVAILLVLCISSAYSQDIVEFGHEQIENHYYLGFNLIPTTSGSMVNFVEVRAEPGRNKQVRSITRESFLSQLAGRQYSKANPDGRNYFEDHNISNPFLVDSLWKLRYAEYPYMANQTYKGWAGKPGIPSADQLEMLQVYGINRMSDICYGDDVINLLKALDSGAWIAKYKRGY